jgi:hypothetical protein
MSPSERRAKIIEVVQEFQSEGKALSANDLLRVLTKRMPGWKPTKEEVEFLAEEIMNQDQGRDDEGPDEVKPPAPTSPRLAETAAAAPKFNSEGHGIAVTIVKLKELLQHHTKEDLIALLELVPPK